MPALPQGTVTFLFSDVEGSTTLLQELGAERYRDVLRSHRDVLRAAFARHGGVELGTEGDSFFVVFPAAVAAAAAAAEAQAGLAGTGLRVRMGLHTGEPLVGEDAYVGIDVHRAARIASAAHGGQVLLSEVTARLVDQPLRDLGDHRLKDLTRAERLYQLGSGEFPPPRSLNTTNLPLTATALIGRRHELAEVVALLRNGSRLVTVTGAGGTGKTRLALAAAAELAHDFDDGVWWVPLAMVGDPALVIPAIGVALGCTVEVVTHLSRSRCLLVLDNCEQVLDASPELADVLSATPAVRMLVTSRAPLRIHAEHEYHLEPLGDREAVEFFLLRAAAIGRPLAEDDDVRAICRRLDNIPLALELAAARTRLLDATTLRARLARILPLLTRGSRDAPARQQTLERTIAWSHDLLDADSQRLFRRAAVFAGSFSLSAVEEVADSDLDALATIVDHNLLKPIGSDRFLMLDTIREFAIDRLDAAGEADAYRARHAQHFVAIAEAAEGESHTAAHAAWLRLLEEEHDNLRAALRWSIDSDPAVALRLVAGLRRFWRVRAYLPEARAWIEAALRAGAGQPARLRAPALVAAATVERPLGDLAGARASLEEALAFFRSADDPASLARTLANLGEVATVERRLDDAGPLLREAEDIFERLGDTVQVAILTLNRGYVALLQGALVEAHELFSVGLTGGRASGNPEAVANALANLGSTGLRLGRVSDASAAFREALDVALELGDRGLVAYAIEGLAVTAAASDPLRAATLLGRASGMRDEMESALDPAEQDDHDAAVERLRSELPVGAFDAAWRRGLDLDWDAGIEAARSDQTTP